MADEAHKAPIPIACHVCLTSRKIIDYCRLIAAYTVQWNLGRCHAVQLSFWNYTIVVAAAFSQLTVFMLYWVL